MKTPPAPTAYVRALERENAELKATRDFDAARLRVLARTLGCEDAVPDVELDGNAVQRLGASAEINIGRPEAQVLELRAAKN